MPNHLKKTPKNTISEDPGDDIQRRYRYQAACAAIFSLSLLSVNSEFECLYCEHHEDILIKKVDGNFIAIQVKTQKSSLGAFTANHKDILKSLKRFVIFEKDFPGKFSGYVLATNCGFWEKEKNSSNLKYILKEIKKNQTLSEIKKDGVYSSLINKLVNKTKCDKDLILTALKKVKTDKKPDFNSIIPKLVTIISEIFNISHKPFYEIQNAAKSLVEKMITAASLEYDPPHSSFYAILRDAEQIEKDDIIQGKMVNKEKIENIIEQSINMDIVLWSLEHFNITQLPENSVTMEIKMEAGEISYDNIENMKDLKFSAEKILREWQLKYGIGVSNDRYQQLRLIARAECLASRDLAKSSSDNPYGGKMLIILRERLKDLCQNDRESVFGCNPYHLLGISGILTEECVIWWNEKELILEENK